jgi:hypothetical protein
MTADLPRPHLASVSIRRLVLPEGQASPPLAEAIAAALASELARGSRAVRAPGVAQAVAQAIAHDPVLAATGALDRGRS